MKSAIEKRDRCAPAKVETLTAAKGPSYPPGRMLISSPLELDAVIRRIPEGRVLTVGALRANLARNHRADYTCPVTTGTFLRIVAEAAEEERATMGGRIAPYWRVVQDDGALLDTLPGGIAAQARRLAEEGVVVFHLGKVPVVSDVDHHGWHPPQLGKAAGRRPPPGPKPPRRPAKPRGAQTAREGGGGARGTQPSSEGGAAPGGAQRARAGGEAAPGPQTSGERGAGSRGPQTTREAGRGAPKIHHTPAAAGGKPPEGRRGPRPRR